MKRGDIIRVAAGGGFGGKPRPALIVQSDAFGQLNTVVVALFTTTFAEPGISRPRFEPNPDNGLATASDLMVDILVTARREQVGGMIGRLTDDEMDDIDRALTIFLGLAE